MLGLQIKAFSVLLALLLLVDAFAFQGEYRGRLGGFLASISPTHWTGMGGGRDWSSPGRPRR